MLHPHTIAGLFAAFVLVAAILALLPRSGA